MLLYAFRDDAPEHARYRQWLTDVLRGDEPVGLSDLVLSGFLRVVTHRGIFRPPTPPNEALAFVDALVAQPSTALIRPGARHWEVFRNLYRESGARGNLVADAYLAALAIEHGCEFMTTDRDFARFPGLRWRHPLAAP